MSQKKWVLKGILMLCVLVFAVRHIYSVDAKKISSMKNIVNDTIEIPMIFLFSTENPEENFVFHSQVKALIAGKVTYHEKKKQRFTIQCIKKRMEQLYGTNKFSYYNSKQYPFQLMRKDGETITYFSGDWGKYKPIYRIMNIRKLKNNLFLCNIKATLLNEKKEVVIGPKYIEYTLKGAKNSYGYHIVDIQLKKE